MLLAFGTLPQLLAHFAYFCTKSTKDILSRYKESEGQLCCCHETGLKPIIPLFPFCSILIKIIFDNFYSLINIKKTSNNFPNAKQL
jgi:hypothetical protein